MLDGSLVSIVLSDFGVMIPVIVFHHSKGMNKFKYKLKALRTKNSRKLSVFFLYV